MFQTCVIMSFLVQTNVKLPSTYFAGRAFVDSRFDNDENVASRLRNIPISRLEYKDHLLFTMTKMAKIS